MAPRPKPNKPNPNRDDVLYGTNVVTDAFGTRFAPYGVTVRGGQQPVTPKQPYMEILNEGQMAKLRPMTTKSGESVGAQPKDTVTINGVKYAKVGSKTMSSKSLSRQKGVEMRRAAKKKELDKNKRES
jgi:hypothetical protein